MSLWETHTLDVSDEEIRAAFHRRHSRPPAEIWRDGTIVHAGPITADEHRRKTSFHVMSKTP